MPGNTLWTLRGLPPWFFSLLPYDIDITGLLAKGLGEGQYKNRKLRYKVNIYLPKAHTKPHQQVEAELGLKSRQAISRRTSQGLCYTNSLTVRTSWFLKGWQQAPEVRMVSSWRGRERSPHKPARRWKWFKHGPYEYLGFTSGTWELLREVWSQKVDSGLHLASHSCVLSFRAAPCLSGVSHW